jgi:hypothetical protein
MLAAVTVGLTVAVQPGIATIQITTRDKRTTVSIGTDWRSFGLNIDFTFVINRNLYRVGLDFDIAGLGNGWCY